MFRGTLRGGPGRSGPGQLLEGAPRQALFLIRPASHAPPRLRTPKNQTGLPGMHCPGPGLSAPSAGPGAAFPESFARHLVTKWLPEGDGRSLQVGRRRAPRVAAAAAEADGLSRGPGRRPRAGMMKCRARVRARCRAA